MNGNKIPFGAQARRNHEIHDAGARFGRHVVAIAAGIIMTVVGLGMGVTIVLLPIGIPVGLLGIMTLIWGLVDWNKTTH